MNTDMQMSSSGSIQGVLCVAIAVVCLVQSGCGKSGPQTVVVYGVVTVDGEKPDAGEVRFVPLPGTPGSTNAAAIVNGEYRIEGRGGVEVGRYRVEVSAKRKTGRQMKQYNGFEVVMMDEMASMLPKKYSNKNSPLTEEITPDSNGRIDINITTK